MSSIMLQVNNVDLGLFSGLTLWKIPSSKCATRKPGLPPRIGSPGSILRSGMELHTFWQLSNFHKEDILLATTSHYVE